MVIKLKTQIVMKFKNSNCDETQKLTLWWNLTTQTMMLFKKLKLGWNSKTEIGMKLKNSKCDQTKKNSNFNET